MTRPINVTMLGHLQNDITIFPFIAVALVTGSGAFYHKTNSGNVTIGGNVFLGDGTLSTVSVLSENREASPMGIGVTYAGGNSALLAALIANNSAANSVQVYIGLQDQNNQLIGVPITLGPYMLSNPVVEVSASSFTITVTIEDYLQQLTYSNCRCFNDVDQQARHPGDTFFSLLATLGFTVLQWGQANSPAAPPGYGGAKSAADRGAGLPGRRKPF